MPPILNFVSPALALKYLTLCFLTVTGAIQIAAGRREIQGLSLFPYSFRSWQVLMGLLLIAGAFAVFFAITPEVFIPGLAGSELMTLFGCGGLIALAFSATIAELRGDNRFPPFAPDAEESMVGGTAALFGAKPGEKVEFCLVPDPWEPFSLDSIARRLADLGHKVAVLHWQAIPDGETALGYLNQALEKFNPEVIVGHRAGGNIVLRLASDNRKVKVIALAPFTTLEEAKPGLGWLEEGGILTAWRRLRGRYELLKHFIPVAVPPNADIINPDNKPWGMVLSEGVAEDVLRRTKEGERIWTTFSSEL